MLVCISMLCRCLSWYPLWLLLLAADSQAPVLPVCGILFGGSLLCSTCVRLLRLRLSSRKRLAFLR